MGTTASNRESRRFGRHDSKYRRQQRWISGDRPQSHCSGFLDTLGWNHRGVPFHLLRRSRGVGAHRPVRNDYCDHLQVSLLGNRRSRACDGGRARGVDKATIFVMFSAIYGILNGLRSMTDIFYGVSLVLLVLGIALSTVYPLWLGWGH